MRYANCQDLVSICEAWCTQQLVGYRIAKTISSWRAQRTVRSCVAQLTSRNIYSLLSEANQGAQRRHSRDAFAKSRVRSSYSGLQLQYILDGPTGKLSWSYCPSYVARNLAQMPLKQSNWLCCLDQKRPASWLSYFQHIQLPTGCLLSMHAWADCSYFLITSRHIVPNIHPIFWTLQDSWHPTSNLRLDSLSRPHRALEPNHPSKLKCQKEEVLQPLPRPSSHSPTA